MEKRNVFRMSIFGKLFLVVALFVGGGNAAWAEVWKLTFENGVVPAGWTGSKNTYSPYAAQYTLTNGVFEPASSYQTPTLTSDEAKSITATQRIVIKAKVDGNTSAYVSLKKSTTSSFSSSSTKFEASKIDFASTGYTTLVIDNFETGSYYLQFQVSHASIESIELLDDYDFCFDENNPMYAAGGYKTCKLKYTAVKGWNTIVLPFGWSDYKTELFGSDASFYALASYSDNILTFATPNYSIISASTPYIVYAPNAPKTQSDITVNNKYVSYATHSASNGGATFQGTYATKSYQEGDDWYGVTSDGKVMQAGEGAYVKGYRAYFTGISAPVNGARPTIVLVDDGGLTDVGFVKMIDQEAKDVYTLSGQKVEKAGRGIYVVNGRKVVIK